MQFLLVIANSASMYEAAEKLNVNRTTVSRKIEALEAGLGVKLLAREGRGLKLTEAGEQAVQTAEQLQGEMLSLKRRVTGRDEQLSGLIRFTATPKIAMLIEPDVTRFRTENPEIVLDIRATLEREDPDLLQSDLALRLTNSPPEHLVGRRLAEPASALYASTQFAEHFSGTGEVNYIESAPVLDVRNWMTEELGLVPKPVLQCNSIELIAQFVQSGLGVAYLPCYVGEYRSSIARVSQVRRSGMPDLWLLYHPRQRHLKRVKALAEVVSTACERLKPIIEGEVLSSQQAFSDLNAARI